MQYGGAVVLSRESFDMVLAINPKDMGCWSQ